MKKRLDDCGGRGEGKEVNLRYQTFILYWIYKYTRLNFLLREAGNYFEIIL